LGGNFSVVQKQLNSPSDRRYIATVFLRTGLVTAAWFGLTGIGLNALSDRALLQCHRNEESLAECELTIKSLVSQAHIDLTAGEIQAVRSQSISNNWSANLVRWETTIATSKGNFIFSSYGIASENNWENFTNRTNKFLSEPEVRTIWVESDYSYWFKFLIQAVSGISILCGLFIIPGLLLTLKYGSNLAAQEEALNLFFAKLAGVKSLGVTED
jgi:hypothetical protein